ncbi:MAG: type II secretion system F family protein [Chloroflexi bacterium]|nr:type II secretion system F family protein [Chloroflexota bacterium]MBI2983842.1 type II secretion system F family protein [Chloroflexota bacterium]
MSLGLATIALSAAAGFVVAVGALLYLAAPAERGAAQFLTDARPRPRRFDIAAALDASPPGRRIARDAEAAGMTTRPSSLLFLSVGLLVIGYVLLPGFVGDLGAPAAVVVALVPYVNVRRRAGMHAREFKRQLPAALDLIANGLRAGQTEVQAFRLVATEMTGSAKEEFERLTRELELGATVESVTASLHERLPDPDLELAVDAIALSHRVGGDLAKMLSDIAQTIRDRDRLSREVGALTAQGRASVWFVTALAPVGLFAVSALNPEWGRLMFQTGPGRLLLGVVAALVALGFFVARRAARVEV